MKSLLIKRDISLNNYMKQYHIVYKTTCLVNGKVYIGVHSTNNITDNYIGSGTALIAAIKKHGRNNFCRKILHIVSSRDEAFKIEESLVTEDFVNNQNTYNTRVGGESSVENHKQSTKEIWKIQRTGRKSSPETIKKRVESRKGYKHLPETIEKIRLSNTGKVRSLETRKKLSNIQKNDKNRPKYKAGHIVSDETKEKMSEAAKARKGKYKHSEETKCKIKDGVAKTKSSEQYNYITTEETKRKISESVKKTKQLKKQLQPNIYSHETSEETKRKISESIKRVRQFKKEQQQNNAN
jgi:hypothetical protein